MATTNLNIRMDKDVKDQAEQIFSALGLNMTTAINIFLKTSIREKGIPFALKLVEILTGKETADRIAAAICAK